ncbi:NAD-dependent epimerase/dehydratase family protein [Gryllotalpicola daejeonensis]|uniref:NAD-dependent epimerase/dehydratase family protein n=1 Tax=Gryllotalpicola daejeonensis TaxID=993087 RepID=A0ABP7ZN74_9MICO
MAKSVVIGANGFIGSHLVDALVGAGHQVRAFDRFSNGTVNYQAGGVEQLVGDFLSRADLEAAVAGCDYVFHFLSTTTPATAEADPTLDLRTNLIQSVELLDAAAHAGIRHLYLASTGGAIYGQQSKDAFAEDDVTEPVSPYAIGKLAIENYLRYYDAKHGLKSTALRISNPYGTRQHPNKKQGLIPIALRQIALGQPVVQFGDGSMVRDYIYVEDLVQMIVRMIGKGEEHLVYNLGRGIGHSVAEILAVIREVVGRDFEIDRRPSPPTFVDRVVLDINRYTSTFGDVDFTSLADGVTRTYREIESENVN